MKNEIKCLWKKINPLLLGAFISVFLSVDFSRIPKLAAGESASLMDGLTGCFHGFGTVWMVLPFAIAALIHYAQKAQNQGRVRENIGLCVVSGVFGILNTWGQELYYTDHLQRFFPGWILVCLYALSCALLFYYLGLSAFAAVPLLVRTPQEQEKAVSPRKVFLIAFGVILAGWLPWMIAYYPFSADWDVYLPIGEYLGYLVPNNSFPWFYASNVGFFYALGQDLGDKNIGVFLYVLLRALIMSAIYANVAVKMRQRGVKRRVVWGVILFYALVPVWGAYAKHGFKDTLSAALFCLFVTETVEIADQMKNGEINWLTFVLYAVSALFASLYRNNVILITAPVTLVLVILALAKPQYRKRKLGVCAVLVSGLIVYGGYMYYIFHVEGVEPGTSVDAMSVLWQQTARTVRDHGDEITQEERDNIDWLMDYDQLAEKYDPLLSDPVKPDDDALQYCFPPYFEAWKSMLFKYPVSYVEAAVAQGYGYYAFTPDQAENAGNWNCGMTIFNWVKDPRFDPNITCDYIDGLEGVRAFLEQWAKLWHQLPLLGLSDVKALYTWLIVLIGYFMIRQKRLAALVPVLACVINILLCCFSPVNDAFRYYCPIAAAAPAVLLLLAPKQKTEEKIKLPKSKKR